MSLQFRDNISLVEEAIQYYVIKNLKTYFNKHKLGKGLWNPTYYFRYLRKQGIKLNPTQQDLLYDGYANPLYFDKIGTFTFKLKKNKSPSDAIISFLEGPTIADCGVATMAIYYKTLLDILGKDKFDEIFHNNLLLSSNLDFPLAYFFEGPDDMQVADHLHLGGVKWYANKHPEGFDGGWNVIYIGNNKDDEKLFMGHTLRPITHQALNKKLISDYNTPRTRRDWAYAKNNDQSMYDRDSNKWLRDFYTISPEDAENNPEKYLEGYLPETQARLSAMKIAEFL